MDMNHQADEAWYSGFSANSISGVRQIPKTRGGTCGVGYLRILRHAWRRVASNRGGRTVGVEGATVGRIRNGIGEHSFLEGLQAELHSSGYPDDHSWPGSIVCLICPGCEARPPISTARQ